MKKTFLFIIFCLILTGTGSGQIKITTGDVSGYYAWEELDRMFVQSNFFFVDAYQSSDFAYDVVKLINNPAKLNLPEKASVTLCYYFLVNEEGKVEQIKPITDYPHVNTNVNPDAVTEKIAKLLEGKQFKINTHIGKPVKYSYRFEKWHRFTTDFDNVKEIPSRGKGEETSKTIRTGEYAVTADKLPEPVNIPKPVYPVLARLAGIQGTVMINAFVDEKGEVNHAVVAKGIGKDCDMDEQALAVIKATKFKPGSIKGKPVKVQVQVPVIFELENK